MIKTLKLSRCKRLTGKVYDVVSLYLSPPDKSLVFCVDEKHRIQVLNRIQPGLPINQGYCGTVTHDYKRDDRTTLFGAASMLDGKATGDSMPRHRHQGLTRFLERIDGEIRAGLNLHLIVDNYGVQNHSRVESSCV